MTLNNTLYINVVSYFYFILITVARSDNHNIQELSIHL